MKHNKLMLTRAAAALALAFGATLAHGAATIQIVNLNAPGVGFNDTTAAAPVGGNTGTTLGEQRLIAFTHAANIWGASLDSAVPIRIGASFEPRPCTATGAVLGSAGAVEIFYDFDNAPLAGTWYSSALAAKLAGVDVTNQNHIRARFNSELGKPGCLTGTSFYLGLDANEGPDIDFVATLLHEMGHGLGFQTFTDGETGEYADAAGSDPGHPSVWDHFLTDNHLSKTWVQSTQAERAASAISIDGLSWGGALVTADAPSVLDKLGLVTIGGPAAGGTAGNKPYGDASFGQPVGHPVTSGQVMPVVDQANGTGLACDPLGAANALAVRGNVALVDRGTCDFVTKVLNVQAAGAIGMVVADNQPGDVAGMSGSDPSVSIPSVRVTQAAGASLKAILQHRSRSQSGVVASLGLNTTQLAGTDAQGRILMYTPTLYSPGSTVSHYTTEAKPNQLMEPAINDDLSHEVTPPRDLTYPLLQDIGW
jgi:hypothetical protein